MLIHLHKFMGRVTCLLKKKNLVRLFIVYPCVLVVGRSALKLD